VAEHLDFSDLCLNRELSLCDRFIDKEAKISISHHRLQKVHKKEEQKQKQKEQLDSYIQTLARI
jgi:hypothetical protein